MSQHFDLDDPAADLDEFDPLEEGEERSAGDLDEADEHETDRDGSDRSTGQGISQAARRHIIRRSVAKAVEVSEAHESTRALAAHLLGTPADVASLTVAIMLAPRTATQPVDDLAAVREADAFTAAVTAAALGRPRMQRVWALLRLLDVAPEGELRESASKAGIKLAKLIHTHDLTVADEEIEAAVKLLKKA